MSLKRLITGKPGNIREFAQMTKETGITDVDILFHSLSNPGLTGDEIMDGRIIYSSGNYEQVLGGRNLEYIQQHDRVRTEKRMYTGEEMITELMIEAEPNLDYLNEQNIGYNIRILNEAD